MDFENFEKFLKTVDEDLEKIFDFQKEYICCKKGCSLCCQKGDYPLSELEFKYLMQEYEKLPISKQRIIQNNINRLKDNYSESYVCPFLVNNECSVYSHRPFVCRTFGVLMEDAEGKPSFPFCATLGLNFSQIYDEKKGHLTDELVVKNNFKVYPRFFKLSEKVIINLPLAKELNITFGELKKLIDFL